MHCEGRQERLQEYLDGQLCQEEAETFALHLAACAHCRQELALLQRVDRALATIPLEREPADLLAQVMDQVQDVAARSADRVPLPRFGLRWEDAVLSFALSCAMASLYLPLALLPPQSLAAGRTFLQQTWWTLSAEIDYLVHTTWSDPIYPIAALSGLGMAVAAGGGAWALLRQWSRASGLRARGGSG